MGLLKEFKEFALKGSVVDLAVGVVIGVAFNTVVNSLVQDVMMPPLGLLTGGVDFKDKKITLKHAVLGPDGQVVHPAVNITYGVFINDVINFVIVALAIFIVIKLMNSAKRQPPPAPATPPPPTKEEVLLAEIRDAIRAK